jgi:hypothetical protein
MTRNEARRIAANIAKLQELSGTKRLDRLRLSFLRQPSKTGRSAAWASLVCSLVDRKNVVVVSGNWPRFPLPFLQHYGNNFC